jgi:hypothetical protein
VDDDTDETRITPSLKEQLEPAARAALVAAAGAAAAMYFGPEGGVIATALTNLFMGWGPNSRVRAAMAYTNSRVSLLEGRLSDLKAETAARILLGVAQTVNPEKLQRLRLALVDRMQPDADAAWDSWLIDCVTTLDTLDINVLEVVKGRGAYEVVAQAAGVSVDLVRASLARLERLGLIVTESSQAINGGPVQISQTSLADRLRKMLTERPEPPGHVASTPGEP